MSSDHMPIDNDLVHPVDPGRFVENSYLVKRQHGLSSPLTELPVDGIPYWDTGAPNLYKLGDYLNKPADPFNTFEPVDSSAAAIGAQGLLRLGKYLQKKEPDLANKYWQSGITVLNTLLD